MRNAKAYSWTLLIGIAAAFVAMGATAVSTTFDASAIVSGTLSASRGGAGTANGILKANGTGTVSAAAAGTDYLSPSGSGASLTSLNASNIASGTLSASYGGAGTANGILKANGSGVVSAATAGTDYYKTGSTTSAPMFIGLYGGVATPVQNTNYYFGAPVQVSTSSMTTTATRRRFYFPSAGTITKAYVTVVNDGGTAGTSETSTLYIRLNNSTDTSISSSIVTNSTGTFNNTGLSLAVSAGDYIELKWATPTTYSTAPTNIEMSVQLEFHP